MNRQIILNLCLALALLAACNRGAPSGRQVTPESVSMDFVRAVVAGDITSAEKFLIAGAGAALKGKVQNAIEVLSRYDIEDVELASSREWLAGSSDRRVEIRFKFRPKGASADEAVKIGLITARAVASGGLFSVADVILDRPTQ